MSTHADNLRLSKDKEEVIKPVNPEKETKEKDIITVQSISLPDINIIEANHTKEIKNNVKKTGCGVCNKRLNIVESSVGKCKCDLVFCSKHRFPKEHQCTYDYKSINENIIIRNNPIIRASKLNKI